MKNTFFEKIVLNVTTGTKSIKNKKMKNYEKQGTQKIIVKNIKNKI